MEAQQVKYQNLLIHEFDNRNNRNPAYSLRAYARDLGISASSLSRILSGKQDLSLKKAIEVVKVLGLNKQESEYFFTLLKATHSRTKKSHRLIKAKLASKEMKGAELSLEYFKTISDWHYFAILELTKISDFKSDPKWISERLNLDLKIVKESIERLLMLKLIEVDSSGKLSKTYEFKATPSGIPNRALKLHHQQIMKKAETALFENDIRETDFTSITFSMSSKDIVWAKEELKNFRRELTIRLAQNKSKDRLYELSMQLFPLDVGRVKRFI